MSAAPVIHIGGWPGAGKRTIGRIVADQMDGRLIDNHLMLDAARSVYDRGTEGCPRLREEVRAVIWRHAKALPRDVPIILTDALADEPAALPLFQPACDLAAAREAPLHIFVLELASEENQRRLIEPARQGGYKLTDADVLADIRATETLFVPEGAIVIDVTALSAKAAATEILRRVQA